MKLIPDVLQLACLLLLLLQLIRRITNLCVLSSSIYKLTPWGALGNLLVSYGTMGSNSSKSLQFQQNWNYEFEKVIFYDILSKDYSTWLYHLIDFGKNHYP